MIGFIIEFVLLSAIFLFANFSLAEEEQFYADTFLPAEYRQIEYLQGDGEAYIQLDFAINSNSDANQCDNLEAKVALTDLESNVAIFCSRGNNTTTTTFSLWYIGGDNKKFRFDYNKTVTGYHNFSPEANVIYTLYASNNVSKTSMGTEYKYTASNFTSGGNAMLFRSYYNGTSNNHDNKSTHRLYSLVVKRKTSVLRDYIPCIRRSDGAVGLYERRRGKFVTNASKEGAFVAGRAAVGFQSLSPIDAQPAGGAVATPSVGEIVDAATGETIASSNYEVSYSDNMLPGVAKAIVTGKAGTPYEGVTLEIPFEMADVYYVTGEKLAVEGSGLSWSSPISWTNALAKVSKSTRASEIWVAGNHFFEVDVTHRFDYPIAVRGGFCGEESSPAQRENNARTEMNGQDLKSGFYFYNAQKAIVDGISFVRCKVRGLRRESSFGDITITNCAFIACGVGMTSGGANDRETNAAGGSGLSIVGNGFSVATIVDSDLNGNVINGSGHDGAYAAAMLAHNLKYLYLSSCNIQTNMHKNWRSAGAEGVYVYNTPATIDNCLFRGNAGWCDGASSLLFGGACSNSVVRNTAFVGNFVARRKDYAAKYGVLGVNMNTTNATIHVENCTFAYNFIEGGATTIKVAKGNLSVRNSVFWKNQKKATTTYGADIHLAADCCGNIDWTYINNDPYYVTAANSENLVFGENITSNIDPLFALSTEEFLSMPCDVSLYSASGYSLKRLSYENIIKLDVHPLSTAGYYDNFGVMHKSEGENSPLIDGGDPDSDYSKEAGGKMLANGGRVNIGAYGGTPFASHTEQSTVELSKNPEIVFEGQYTQPTIKFALGGQGAYNARAVVEVSTNGVDWYNMPYEYNNLTNGQEMVMLVPKYYLPGTKIQVKVTLNTNVSSTTVIGDEFDVVGNIPLWFEKGGDSEKVVHVRSGATGLGDGTTWTDAVESIADALKLVTQTRNEIWVAQTNYLSASASSYQFSKPVTLRGGFVGAENTVLERKKGLNSLFDGQNKASRCFEFSNSASLVIERFDFVRATGLGAYRTGGSGDITFVDCRFISCGSSSTWNYNKSFWENGGACARLQGSSSSILKLVGCEFSGAVTTSGTAYDLGCGGGLFLSSFKRAVLDGCTFMTNAPNSGKGWRNGGVSTLGVFSTPIEASNCEFRANSAPTKFGISVSLYGACSNSVFRNCVFTGNTHGNTEGDPSKDYYGILFAGLSTTNDTLVIDNCTFAYNINRTGTAFHAYKGRFTVRNSVFHANVTSSSAGHGADISCRTNATVDVSYTMFDENSESCFSVQEGGSVNIGKGCVFSDPLLATSTETFQSKTGNTSIPYGSGTFSSIADRLSLNVHLRGARGYYSQGTGALNTDYSRGIDSPALDSGDPSSDYSVEPNTRQGCHGNRINMGAYGNTPWATMTVRPGSAIWIR